MKRHCAWMAGVVIAAAGCGSSEVPVRTYQEVLAATAPPVPARTRSPAPAPVSVSWVCPDGWTEQPAAGMRLATFLVDGSECTLIRFPGSVGGLAANIERWVRQLDRDMPPAETLKAFMDDAPAVQSRAGWDGRLYDFRRLLPDADPSMLVAVFSIDDALLFAKLQGSHALLERERDRFHELCLSLH